MADETAPRRVNLLALLTALIFLGIASVGFSGNLWWAFNSGTKWMIAGLVAVVGVGMLASALPRGGARKD